MPELAHAHWRKSTRSNQSQICVEVADNLPGIVAVRDSKHPTGPALVFSPAAFATFTAGVKQGRFDRR